MIKVIKWIISLLVLTGLYFVVAIYWVGYQRTDIKPADAIVVFGAAQYNGVPSPIFAARLDHAEKLYEQKKAKKIIVTGGKGLKGDITSEGRAGRNYLVDSGVDASDIIFEEESHNTQENIHELEKILDREKIKSVIFVSDRFHMFRIAKMAEKANLDFQLSPTKTSPVEKNKSTEFVYVLQEIRNYFSFLMLSS